MAISLASLRSARDVRPPRITLYGVAGIGKTSFAAQAPSPVFIQTEDGLGQIDAPTFGLLKTYEDVMEAIGSLYTEPHDYKTVVLDSLDWLEPMVATSTCKANGWANIETPGYGKGYVAALDGWRVLLEGIAALRDERNMAVVLIAHSDIKKFDAPDTEGYSRYVLKLHAKVAALISESSDVLGFANYRVSTVKTESGFNKKVVRGVGSGERLLHVEERPAYIAKQRYNIPDTIPLEWDALASGIPYYTAAE